jgi:hypothetical protein
MRVAVFTEGGQEVWSYDSGIKGISHAIPSAPSNAAAHSLLRGLARAIQDAEVIEAGGDPERPSEKAMRLAEEERQREEEEEHRRIEDVELDEGRELRRIGVDEFEDGR